MVFTHFKFYFKALVLWCGSPSLENEIAHYMNSVLYLPPRGEFG